MNAILNPEVNPLVDQIGMLRLQRTRLEEQEAALLKQLRETYGDVTEGNQFRVVFTDVPEWKAPDWKAIAAKLKPSRQLVVANTKVMRKAHTRVNVTLRKGVQ